jgi:hypothetical protein
VTAAERMRLSRRRRRDGMRVVRFEVRDAGIEGLVTHGLLDPTRRNDSRGHCKGAGQPVGSNSDCMAVGGGPTLTPHANLRLDRQGCRPRIPVTVTRNMGCRVLDLADGPGM